MKLNKMTKLFSLIALSFLLVACSVRANHRLDDSFDRSKKIHVVTREDGSGTRKAFVEIVEVVDENKDDYTTLTATVQNSTSGVMQVVSNDLYAIGYISFSSLDDSIQTLSVDGVVPSLETIANGEYKIARNFNIVYGEKLTEEVEDFYDFMCSTQAQELVKEQGYIPGSTEPTEYVSQSLSGRINIVGSTSVEPLMQQFAEAYRVLNPEVTIDIIAPGSGAGVTAVADGNADIGMISRELDAEELNLVSGVKPIATDGIVLITHRDSPITDLTLKQVHDIYLGEAMTWIEVE